MKAHKALPTISLTFILVLGSLLPALLSSPVLAETPVGQTTLYFTDTLNENVSEFGTGFLSLNAPTKQNDSKYPPNLFIKNTSKLIPRYNLNTNQWLTWMSTWIFDLLGDIPELNSSDFSDLFNGFEILIPNPYRIVEEYSYDGNDSVTINGDIIYNLYFQSDITRQKFRDQVKVELYSLNMNSLLPLPKLIKNNTVELTPGLFSNIYNQQIALPDISYTLTPGDSLLFSIEIIPSNKTLPTLITKYIDLNRFIARWENRANRWENRSNIQKLHDLGTNLKEVISILNESLINITSADFAAILNAMQSSSFIYDSARHPASVSIPAKISEEDIRIYYLHTDQTMDEKRPETGNQSENVKITSTPTLWTSPTFERNKILKMGNTVVDLYLDHRDLFRIINILRGKITITATIYDENISIATSEKKLDRTRILDLLLKPTSPITFTFNGSDTEISYDHSIHLGVSLQNGTKLGMRTVKLLYDSIQFPSALKVEVEETQNIKITDVTSTPANRKIIPGETVDIILNVTSKNADTLHIETIQRETVGDWEIIVPESTTVSANSITTLQVGIKSKNNYKEAYGNSIDLVIITRGNTGIARFGVTAEVSVDAIEYKVEILGYSNSINISKGENRTFYFVIKNNNTGAIDDVDSYTITASSKNNWPLIPRDTIKNLRIGESTNANDARVFIQVPKDTTLDSDIITIVVASDGDPSATATINFTVHVMAGDILESIYSVFDNAAETLGLNEIFGSDGPIILMIIIMVIILFIFIILALVFTIKPVHIICNDRIEEIESTEKAIFDLTLKNPTKKTQTYEIEAQQTASSKKWIITLDPITTIIDGRLTKTVQIVITPTDSTKSKDWTQVTVNVKKVGKKKTESIALLTMMKEGKTLLKLQNIGHWPTTFNPGEKVITSFSLSNNGTVTARNAKVFFYLNGKQKNLVEVTIPAGNIADIQIPWIAEKGKNQLRIRVKE
jgi:hypothetical protein